MSYPTSWLPCTIALIEADYQRSADRSVCVQLHATQPCAADPAGLVFDACRRAGEKALTAPGSRIEGMGRPRVEANFVCALVDRVEEVHEADSILRQSRTCSTSCALPAPCR